jgi:uncharacterized protein (DUF1015 family)
MVTIKAFKGIRPKEDIVEKVVSKPYDVINSEEARTEVKGNDYSFLRVVKSEVDLPNDVDSHDKSIYETARKNLDKFIKENVLIQDKKPMLYIYAQTMSGRTQYGIVGCASVEEYEKDIIKKHEFTRKDKEDDRVNHVNITNANTGPVFLTYRDHEKVNTFVENYVKESKPVYSFESDNVKHELWLIEDENKIKEIENYFKEIPELYVADGHHRSASAARVGRERRENNPNHNGTEEYNYYLAVFFPASHLMIMDYNRSVKDLNGLKSEEFIKKIEEKFNVSKVDYKKPKSSKNFCMYLDGTWYNLSAKDGTYDKNDPVNSLDVAILQNNLLSPILGIGDPRTDNRIHFIGGIRGTSELEKIVNSGDFKVSFSLYPTTIEDLMSVADAGLTMPPKSTWFEPKLKSGLLVHRLS